MLRLFGFLVTFAVGVVGYGFVDFNAWRQAAIEEGRVGLSVGDYLDSLPERFARAPAPAAQVSGLPTELAAMLPPAPSGWTVRPAVPEDAASFLPREAGSVPRADRKRIEAIFDPAYANGPETVILTYERGERRVVLRAIRHENEAVATPTARARRDMLAKAQNPDLVPIMTVRGLDLSELPLPGEIRGRHLVAFVGTQIQLELLVSSRLDDADLLPFLETLHVQAMNASVLEPQPGLGELPVIVLAAALDEPLQEAFKADRAAQKARLAEAIGSTTAEPAVPPAPEVGLEADCDKQTDGSKFCTVSGN